MSDGYEERLKQPREFLKKIRQSSVITSLLDLGGSQRKSQKLNGVGGF